MNEQRSIWTGLFWASATWSAHFFVFFVVVMTFAVCVPGVEFMYDKLNMDLPSITMRFLAFSHFVTAYWYLLVIPLFLDFAFLIGASLSGPKLRWLARAWSTSLLLGTILLLGMTILAISFPFQEYAREHADDADVAISALTNELGGDAPSRSSDAASNRDARPPPPAFDAAARVPCRPPRPELPRSGDD